MRIAEYITNLRNNNIIVTVREEQLIVNDPNEMLTQQVIEELKKNKQEIIDFFNSMKRKESSKAIPKAPKKEYYTLSSVQKRMYFLYEFDKNGVSYNMPLFYRLGRSLDRIKFDKAVKQLVARHQSLHTVFSIQNDIPVQSLLDISEFEIVYKQIQANDIDKLVSEFVRPFNLSQEFPFRVTLVDVIDEDYLLMTDTHHIINDGVSNEILTHDLWALYAENNLLELNIEYTDYVEWQQSESYQESVSEHREYWLEIYNEDVNTLELPLDNPRPLIPSDEGGTCMVKLSKIQSDQLRALASFQGVTMYALFLSLYNVLLSKLSNQTDIIVGTPTAGRNHADLEGIVGMFVNTLALRNKVDSKMKFDELLVAVQETTLAAFDHQMFQYDELVDALEISREANSNPLFDVFFSYSQGIEASSYQDLQIIITDHKVASNIAKFDLSLDVVESEEINLCFEYRKDLFTASSITRFLDYLVRMIDEIIKDKSQTIKDIDILSKEEKSKLLFDFNNTKTAYDLDQTVLDLFKNRVEETPNSEALIMDDVVLSYKELDNRSALWAHHLVDYIEKGEIVGLMMTRSVEMIVAIIAIMKSGGAYLPLNPEQPMSRTLVMLEECEASLILSNLENIGTNFIEGYTYITPKDLDEKSQSNNQPLRRLGADDVAYIIYTSGSTGRPKGVMVNHRGVSNLIQHQVELYDVNQEENILLFSPYYFDASVSQIWLALVSGERLVVFKEEDILDVNRFNSSLKKYNITHLDCTPSFLETIELEEGLNLKRIIVGGEACKLGLADKLLKKYDLYNEYGPTETTVTSTFKKIEQADVEMGKIPIGRPIANTQVYILDKDMNLLPEGVAGELYIGGLGITNGYINNEMFTKERFIDNPFDEGFLYKTGDLVKWLPEGMLEYLGRNDNQVKIRGHRIELGEIEAELELISEVNQALVMAHGEKSNKQLVAYLCLNEEKDTEEINSFLSDKLPLYMLPSHYVKLDRFPVNANGKIDKKLLPSPDFTIVEEYIAAENDTQRRLVTIWSQVLDIEEEKISITSDFFKLGGHSLLAITLINKIRKIYNVDIAIRDFFAHRTIAALSLHISKMDQVTFLTIPKAELAHYYLLSSAQRRMYFLYEFDRESTVYNMPTFFKLTGVIDTVRLASALKNLVIRHQSLRTTFKIVNDVPVQHILDASNFHIDFQKGNISLIDVSIVDFIRPFNLSEDFPFRASLLEISAEEYLLMIDMHHIISDGVSFEILMRELWMLYQGDALSDLTLEYVDYAVWQQNGSQEELALKHKSYWMNVFSEEITPLELPKNRSNRGKNHNEGENHTVRLDKIISNKLKAIAQEEGVTMYALFLSLYNVLLSKLSNQTDIIVGTVTAGRNHADLEGIVGMFVNTLALRNKVDSKMKFDELLVAVQETTLAAFDHQMFQYDELVDALEISREANSNALFDVFFSYGQIEDNSSFPDLPLTITDYKISYNTAKFDLSLDVVESEEINLSFTYRTELFDALLIERFMSYLVRMIDEIIKDKSQTIKDIDILSKEEKSKLLFDFNNTKTAYDLDQTVLDLFKNRVEETPNSEALIMDDVVLSYKELDNRSALWAHHLVDYIEKGEIVGLMMTRSVEMIVAIIAIMKSGGAYLPLNPEQPMSRTAYMLQDCNVNIIISNVSPELEEATRYTLMDISILDNTESKHKELPYVNALDIAYVIYTSGSTGLPKGVLIQHESVSNLIQCQKEYFNIDKDERIVQFSPYYFDASVEQIWLALSSGSALVVLDGETLLEMDSFHSCLRENKVTHLHSTPSFLEEVDFNNLPSLRRVISGGEICKPGLAKKIASQYLFYNEYGPTETTVTSTTYQVNNAIEGSKDKVSIGRPIANTSLYILSDNLELLPEGVAGELYIGGKGLAQGYLKREDLTVKSFISNPFGEGRIYKTGDQARWLPDGTIEYLGRNDDQVKLRGYRIELGEIEFYLEESAFINRAVVLVSGIGIHKKLIAYVCGDEPIEVTKIKTYLSSKVPDYMIPSAFIWMDNFVLNANGKIDKKLLPSPDFTIVEEYIAAENDTQRRLVTIWSQVLDIEEEKISITSDFFKLGGHSLLAITLINKIRKIYNVDIAIRDFFAHRTIAALSLHISKMDQVTFLTIPKAELAHYYLLSSAQRRMYFLYEFDRESTVYNMPTFFKLTGVIDTVRLASALKNLVIRHQSLRTTFKIVNDVPVQHILDASNFHIDFQKGNISLIDVSIVDFIRPFNLSEDFPFRASLLEISAEEYLLMIDMHHIISDGVSFEILMRELWMLYQGDALSDLTLEYVDYAVWQQNGSQEELALKHKSYWMNVFSEEITPLELPKNRSNRGKNHNEGENHTVRLDKIISNKLKAIAQEEGVTMYALFLSLYNVLLSKLSNQTDIIVGTVTAGRNHADLEGIVGMFVNTLALRNKVDSKMKFDELLVAVQETTLAAFDHQMFQYDELVDALEISREANSNALFDVFFSYGQIEDNSSFPDLPLTITDYKISYNTAKFDLSLDVVESEEINLSFTYRTELFDALLIERFMSYLVRMIDDIIKDKSQTIKDIDILSKEEKSKLLFDFNNTKTAYDLDQTVLDLFKNRVEETPNSEALIMDDVVLSYKELDNRSALWAHHLVDYIEKGEIVGLMMTRSVEMIVAIIAIMKSGGAYLPLNPEQPMSRTLVMLEECEASLILSNLENIGTNFIEGYTYITPKDLDEKSQSNNQPLRRLGADDVAYIIYTSGSTGRPKGVMVNHRGVSNLIQHQVELYDVNQEENILLFFPYYFDGSVEQIWLALVSGERLVVFKEEDILDVNRFNSSLKKYNITHLGCTPSFLETIELEDGLNLKRIMVGGEACKLGLADKLLKKYDLYNAYGPTETTVISTFKKIEQADVEMGKIPIGRPIANTQVYILDKDMNLLPEGVAGELYIGGLGITNGYINNEMFTKERFIDNPFDEGFLYKTGDLVKWLPEGMLEYLGRNDNQVKIRGHRIELGEIEAELELISEVNQALVMAHGEKSNKQLVAYLCLNEEKDTEEINSFLSDKLPLYMLPSHYVKLDRFPVNANGKIDKKLLPSPDFTIVEEYIAAENDTQRRLVTIWSQVLDIEEEKISITSDFFKLGGHSLLAITLINKIRKIYNVDIAIRDFFAHRTIAALSLHISKMDQVTFLTIPKAELAHYYLLSSAQRRMYFLYEFDRESTVYNMPTFFKLTGVIDTVRLASALKNLVIRHQSLRTTFKIVNDVPVQHILDASNFHIDFQKGNISLIDVSIVDFIRPFNLSEDFPFRASLLEISAEEYLLMIDMHHIISDGVSFEILMRELWMLYQGDALSDLTLEYVDYAVWQQNGSQEELALKHKSYWMNVFSEEITPLELPKNRSNRGKNHNEGENHTVRLDKIISNKLKAIAQEEGVTMYALFLSLYNVLLSKLSNQTDIIVGTVTAGRNHADLEGIVGMFVNTLALRNKVDSKMKFDELLVAVQETTLAAFDHQMFQYDELVDALEISREANSNALFDVFFSYGQIEDNSSFPDLPLTITDYKISYNTAKFDLSLDVVESEEINLSFTYRTELFDALLIERFMSYLVRMIDEIIKDKSQTIKDIDILSKEEKSKLLFDFNNTKTAYDLDQTVLDLFKNRVEETPNSEALIMDDVVLSYKELDNRSALWAHHLVDYIEKGEIVGLMMTRSVEMIVAIIAIMKSGGAYLPLNPEQPMSRTAYMLQDCNVNIIISNVSPELEEATRYTLMDISILDNTESKHKELPYVNALDIAYVIYTSGSTGLPKGVLIQHESVSNLIQCQKEYFNIDKDERIVQFSPYYFDASVEQIWLALSSGSALVVLDGETLLEMDSFHSCLRENKVTHLHSTPSFLEEVDFNNLPSLRRVISGGEICKPGLAKKIASQYLFYNEYGPTETTVTSTTYQVNNAIEGSKDKVSIGRPIANTSLYILSDNLELLPEGVAGELYIGGKGLAQGYLKREDLTVKSFISNPFGEGRIYKTGDQARWLPDGTIEYLGRNDDQVKLRGYRIELGEIEFYLEESAFINRAVVLVSGIGIHKKLIAYVCGDEPIEVTKIKTYLSSKVPDYMIPSAFIWMDNFVLNANGKIDKKLLPSPDFTIVEEYIAAENDTQRRLVTIWSQVLDIEEEKISITSDFFKLGGHSLLAITLRHLIKKVFEIELPISEIFLTSNIISLAEKISKLENKALADEMVIPINTVKGKEKLFMIHDGSGEINGYLELSRKIKAYSCYGIRFGLFNNMKEAPSISSIASEFIKEMKKIQEVGPYRILGWSLGGEIAVEMATQLESQNEYVDQLIIIDSSLKFERSLETSSFDIESEGIFLEFNFNYKETNLKNIHSLSELWSTFFNSETFKSISINTLRDLLSDEIKQLIPDFLHLNKRELFEAVNKIRLLLNASNKHYIQDSIQAKTLYVWPNESRAIYNKERLSEFFINFDIQEVSGNHFSVMKSNNVISLSQIVNNLLDSKMVNI
ncbi:amino acid adenylation domain-containing protein [Flavobacterium sp. HNIBRBA15423]|uniref:amino acid adenylation domain-containing protein n=1 Tax=Flavobacterium sp. HNIBRBA15423 TaxID=3458683 RepID=UPI004044DE5E